MKKINLIFLLLLISAGRMYCQTVFEVSEYSFKTKEDYQKFEPYIIKAAKWLDENPLEKNATKREEVNAFVIMWLTGTDRVTLELGPKVLDLTEKNPALLIVYMASYSRYVIEHFDTPNELEAVKSALLSIINVYEKSPSHKKEKALEKLLANKASIGEYAKEVLAEGK